MVMKIIIRYICRINSPVRILFLMRGSICYISMLMMMPHEFTKNVKKTKSKQPQNDTSNSVVSRLSAEYFGGSRPAK